MILTHRFRVSLALLRSADDVMLDYTGIARYCSCDMNMWKVIYI